MALKAEDLHFLMIPLLSQSHIIQTTHFSKLLAEKGISISIITTPLNEIRVKKMTDNARARNLKIQTIAIEFPGPKFGLPPNIENFASLGSTDSIMKFVHAFESLQEPLESLIRSMEPKPHCIISTPGVTWLHKVADKFNIPRYVLQVVSSFAIACFDIISETKILDSVNTDSDPFLIPKIPHKIEFTKAQMPKYSSRDITSDKRPPSSDRGILVNTFEEMEPWYFENCGAHRGKVYCVGPISLSSEGSSARKDKGNQGSIDEDILLNWMNSREENSVIYACFGSLSRLRFEQIREIGIGLEKSNHPFIWVIGDRDFSPEVKNWIEGEGGYETRNKERGLICRGWAPQNFILSHRSIGGFITHCGWGSIVESIVAGVPMMTWPMVSEQFMHGRLVVDVLGVGVSFGVTHYNDENCPLITSDKVNEVIRSLMESEVGMEAGRRAKELAKIASKALEKDGSSYLNLCMFIQDVIQQQSHD